MQLTVNSFNDHWMGMLGRSEWMDGGWDSGNQHLDSKDWTADIISEFEAKVAIRTLEAKYEWTAFSMPKQNFWLGRPGDIGPEYKLFAWNMGGWGGNWKPVTKEGLSMATGDVHGWGSEWDRFIWTDNSPMVGHSRAEFVGYDWSMSTWWLKESEFPFDRERLLDFNASTAVYVMLPPPAS
jgi:hypothetical protein